jgi:hypothetical protein
MRSTRPSSTPFRIVSWAEMDHGLQSLFRQQRITNLNSLISLLPKFSYNYRVCSDSLVAFLFGRRICIQIKVVSSGKGTHPNYQQQLLHRTEVHKLLQQSTAGAGAPEANNRRWQFHCREHCRDLNVSFLLMSIRFHPYCLHHHQCCIQLRRLS